MRNKETRKVEMVCYGCKSQSSKGNYTGGYSQTYDITDINL